MQSVSREDAKEARWGYGQNARATDAVEIEESDG